MSSAIAASTAPRYVRFFGRRILHDMGCDDAVDECIEPTRGRARRLRLTRRSEQPAEELGISGRLLETGAAQVLESGQSGEQLVGVKVVDPLELHLARRLRQTRPHPPEHIVEVVDVDMHGVPGIERNALSRQPAAEIAGDQHTHRFAVAAGTPGVRQPEVELKTARHRSLLPQLRTSLEGCVVLGGPNSGGSHTSTTVNAEPAEHAELLFLLIADEPFGTRSPRSGRNSGGSHTSTTVNAEAAEHAESLFLLIADEPFGTRWPCSGRRAATVTATTINAELAEDAEHSFSIDL